MITADDVTLWLGLKPGSVDTQLNVVVATVNTYVAALPVIANAPADDPWPADVTLGATMLAARYWRRRNSPSGVEAITEAGAQYVARHDPDMSRLLRLDGFTRPAVG
jgi:hypothetical protein